MYYIMTEDGWRPWLASHKICDNHNKLEGVFKPQTLEEVRAGLGPRLTRFLAAMGDTNPADHKNFRGHHFIEPLVGAFGEKL